MVTHHDPPRVPFGWRWRSSVWFVTIVVAFSQAVDMLVYAIAIPVVPFKLQQLGYSNVSSKTGWLLFAFSLSMIISTPPISYLSERYGARRGPLICGLLVLMGAQVLFMEASHFWMMLIARVLQGISSTLVWVVALALLCDIVPEDQIGRQLGFAMSGYSFGLIVATPIGGLLYGQLGYRAPFIFGIIVAAIDLAGRLLIIEKTEAENIRRIIPQKDIVEEKDAATEQPVDRAEGTHQQLSPAQDSQANVQRTLLTPYEVIRAFGLSRRPMTVLLLTVVWGVCFTAIEPTLPLRVQSVWNLGVTKVGVIFLAATVPSLLSGPLAGYASDKTASSYIACFCIILTFPWLYPLALSGHLAILVVSLVFFMFFASGIIVPITVELAALSREIPGVGYAHTYGMFNMAYAVGNTVGPIIGGQIYDGSRHGWTILMCVLAGLLIIALTASALLGELPIYRWRLCLRRRRVPGR